MYLLDTVAASEFSKDRPNNGLMNFLLSVDEDNLFLSVATLAEIQYGIGILPPGRRRGALIDWYSRDLLPRFADRIILVTASIAEEWGHVTARRKLKGRTNEAIDALIAATANVHGLSIVTRNVADFEGFARSVLNPWT